jgi:hypothetical protein
LSAGFSFAARQATATARADGTIAKWLLTGPAQVRTGTHTGGVAGCVAPGGSPHYVYPEIAGYYLQWLAWRAQRFGNSPALADGAAAVQACAAAVQAWLAVWLSASGPPLTRVHLMDADDDWRNRAVFCFDLAMVLRGLAAAARARLLVADTAVVAGVSRQLERLVAADGLFDACAPHAAGVTLPERWSTRRGGFLTKAAAGIITATRTLAGIHATVAQAANATFAASIGWTFETPHAEAHPLLYAFEGIMALPRDPCFADALPAVAERFDALLAHAAPDGHIPETLATGTNGPARIDVMAQTLRIGYLLHAHCPQQPPDRVALARLRQALARQVDATGAVGFTLGPAPAQWNVGAAMFADQALAFAVPARDAIPWWRSDPLIV